MAEIYVAPDYLFSLKELQLKVANDLWVRMGSLLFYYGSYAITLCYVCQILIKQHHIWLYVTYARKWQCHCIET